jgi:hypothetical protein
VRERTDGEKVNRDARCGPSVTMTRDGRKCKCKSFLHQVVYALQWWRTAPSPSPFFILPLLPSFIFIPLPCMVPCCKRVCVRRTRQPQGLQSTVSLGGDVPLNFSLSRDFASVNVACAEGQGLGKFLIDLTSIPTLKSDGHLPQVLLSICAVISLAFGLFTTFFLNDFTDRHIFRHIMGSQ